MRRILFFKLFTRDKLIGKNCACVNGKQGIGCDVPIDIVWDSTSKKCCDRRKGSMGFVGFVSQGGWRSIARNEIFIKTFVNTDHGQHTLA